MTQVAAAPRMDPRFLRVAGRRLFALQIVPAGTPRGSVLYLPPFAEEMNRCRSHVAITARTLAARGWRCMLLDPYGTGESEGSIADATWAHWQEDAHGAVEFLRAGSSEPVTLWGLRTGALLAAEIAAALPSAVSRLLLWQPVLDGATFLNQYLRLRIASQIVRDGDKETTASIRERLASGEHIEVAGYPLTSAMADALAIKKLVLPTHAGAPSIGWLELVGKAEQAASPASSRFVDASAAAGARLTFRTVVAPTIWQTYDRMDAPALPGATADLLEQLAA